MGWIGDPIWLEEVLRPALGERLRVLDGWRERGHGDFRDIRGVMWHHTGNSRETAKSIARGRPDLPGPLANLHIAHSGVVTIVAVGVCWHAGRGSYPWLPTDNANWHMIGVECAWPTIRRDGSYDAGERWPDAQIVSMRDVAAALTLKLGYGPERNIGHKEYAGAAQGKWDPGNLSMDWFRAEVAKDTRGEFDHPLGVGIRPRTRTQGLHELGMKRRRLRADRLIRLGVRAEERRNRRRYVICARGQHAGGRDAGSRVSRADRRTEIGQIRGRRRQELRNGNHKRHWPPPNSFRTNRRQQSLLSQRIGGRGFRLIRPMDLDRYRAAGSGPPALCAPALARSGSAGGLRVPVKVNTASSPGPSPSQLSTSTVTT